METNPRIQNEWAPPPPIATPPPTPPIKPKPTSEEEFDGLLGNLVEHYSTLPPPSFGDSPVTDDEKTEISVRVGPPAWVWAVASVALVGIAGAALFLTGVVNLQMLGLGTEIVKTPTAPAPAVSAEDVAKAVKIRVASPKVEPLPSAEPLATPEPAPPIATATEKKEATKNPPVVAVKAKANRKPRGRRVNQETRRTERTRRHARRVASPSRKARRVADDWTDPYQ